MNRERIVSLLFLLFVVILVILLRLPSIFEPHWYGDEGIYASIAAQLSKGARLYSEIWDHKPPMLYWTYQLFRVFGGGYLSALKVLNISLLLLTLFALWGILTELFASKVVKRSITIIVTLLLGSTLLEGNIVNAESFFIFLNLLVMLILIKTLKGDELEAQIPHRFIFLVSGVILGISMLYKIHAVLILPVLIGLWITRASYTSSLRWIVSFLRYLSFLGSGVLVVWGSALLYFVQRGTASEFIYAVFKYNSDYISYAFEQGVGSGFSFWVQVPVVIIALSVLTFLYIRKRLSGDVYVLAIWFVMSVWGAVVSGRYYPHYFMDVVIPATLLLFALFRNVLDVVDSRKAFLWSVGFMFVLYSLFSQFSYNDYGTFQKEYYFEGYRHVLGQTTTQQWGQKLNAEMGVYSRLLQYLEQYTFQPLLLYVDFPWLYSDLNADPITRYVTYYHIYEDSVLEVIDDIDTLEGVYVVIDKTLDVDERLSEFLADSFIQVSAIENGRFEILRHKICGDPQVCGE